MEAVPGADESRGRETRRPEEPADGFRRGNGVRVRLSLAGVHVEPEAPRGDGIDLLARLRSEGRAGVIDGQFDLVGVMGASVFLEDDVGEIIGARCPPMPDACLFGRPVF